MIKTGNTQHNIVRKLLPIVTMIMLSFLIIFFNNKATFFDNISGFSNTPLTKDGFFFDTYVSLTIYDSKDNYSGNIKTKEDIYTLLNECMGLCDKYEKIFSRTLESSELYKLLNNSTYINGDIVAISDSLYECIDATMTYSRVFGDKYSILSGDLCDLWDYNNASIPLDDNIANAINAINNYNILLSDNYIKLEKINMYTNSDTPDINLGASAKGYITDKICAYLKENGISDAIIDLGGNIFAIGDKYDNTMYKIGIKKPFSESSAPYAVCKVAEKAIVTSGIYERYFESDGFIYHHIIDCSTGYPTNNDILSVTIIADNSHLADCYSTGCLLLGSEEALSLINATKEVECVLITKDYSIIISDGLKYDANYIILK